MNPLDPPTYFEEEGGYEMEIWVETTKSLQEFETSLAALIDPLTIENHEFDLGNINTSIHTVADLSEVPVFEGVPQISYSVCLAIQIVDYQIWGNIDRHWAFALAWGLRGKFSCRYLITANCEFFICQAGTNTPTFINTCYRPWASGELVNYRKTNKPLFELHLPPRSSNE